MPKDRMRHRRIDLPSYQFIVYERPKTAQGKSVSSERYRNAIKEEAKKHISTPITSNDVEMEICWATKAREGIRADIDNIIKPTLDSLVGIAFDDDKRVRSVTATLFDLKKSNVVKGHAEDLAELMYSGREDAVQIVIYSDSRLEELGGEDKVKKKRFEEFNSKWEKTLKIRAEICGKS
jgi:Holliday junction resolvase RusA-like endonuclease